MLSISIFIGLIRVEDKDCWRYGGDFIFFPFAVAHMVIICCYFCNYFYHLFMFLLLLFYHCYYFYYWCYYLSFYLCLFLFFFIKSFLFILLFFSSLMLLLLLLTLFLTQFTLLSLLFIYSYFSFCYYHHQGYFVLLSKTWLLPLVLLLLLS